MPAQSSMSREGSTGNEKMGEGGPGEGDEARSEDSTWGGSVSMPGLGALRAGQGARAGGGGRLAGGCWAAAAAQPSTKCLDWCEDQYAC